jgi:hypothetical protein
MLTRVRPGGQTPVKISLRPEGPSYYYLVWNLGMRSVMLAVFSIPKAFTGHVGVIQRNAIRSWTRLEPRPEIILLGKDEGTAEIARDLGARHIAEIATNSHGTPLLRDAFQRAEANVSTALMCYVNADIVLTGEFASAVEAVREKLERFLVVSKRINVDAAEEMSFAVGWESELRGRARDAGVSGDHTAIDVFVFAKGMYREMPDFAVGRLWFDQWLIKAARQSEIAVVDVSRVAPVLHQNHDYNHVSGGEERVWRGAEAAENFRLYGGERHAYTLLSVTHELRESGELRRVRLRTAAFAAKQVLWDVLVRRTVDVRDALRLRRRFWSAGRTSSRAKVP